MCDMEIMLKRLIIMRDEKKLEGKDWMHVLGTSQLDWACFLTQVQRQVRKHINQNFTKIVFTKNSTIADFHDNDRKCVFKRIST